MCDEIVAEGSRNPELRALFTSMRNDTPWLYMDIDRDKCMALGLTMDQVFNALQYNLGSYYVNNFNEFGRNWQVNVQDDPKYRARMRDVIGATAKAAMVPGVDDVKRQR